MAEHRLLTGASLHEPKGVADAAENTVYVADGAGSGMWLEVPFESKWNDVVTSFVGFNPPGGALDAPDVSADDGTLLFDDTDVEVAALFVQMPHSWEVGTVIRPHVHWKKTTDAAGDVAWKLEYKVANAGGDFAATYTDLGTFTDTAEGTVDNDTAARHLITGFGEIDMTGYTESCVLIFKLSRVGTDAGDTYAADAAALSFDVHYLVDSLGSTAEYGDS